jgi:hypothetical protein
VRFDFFSEGYCWWIHSLVLEPLDQRLEFFYFSMGSCGDLSDTPARCSVKCVRGNELL